MTDTASAATNEEKSVTTPAWQNAKKALEKLQVLQEKKNEKQDNQQVS